MSYPFVQAKYYTPGGMVEPRAIVIHFAEGGGTVSWLTHPTNDNSSHFVIEYSGGLVQMVKDADASHSLHVDRPYGPPAVGDFGTYSLDDAKACLGAGIADPCAYIFAVEIEGYAANGPNAAQATSLGALVHDLHARHPSVRGLLGHRDYQNYKACPGGKIPWAALGGHGLFAKLPETSTGGTDVSIATAGVKLTSDHIATFSAAAPYLDAPNGASIGAGSRVGYTVPYIGVSAGFSAVLVTTALPYPDKLDRPTIVYVPRGSVMITPVPVVQTPDTSPFTQVDVDKAVKAAVAAVPHAAPAPVVPDVKHTVTLQIDGVTSFTKAV